MTVRTETKKKIRRIKNLPAVPEIVVKISRMVEDPDATPADAAELISRDQVLSAKILRMANSAFFGMSRKISSITQASIILGFDVVKGLVLTSSVADMVKNSFNGLWEHSIGCAAAAGTIARAMGRDDAEEMAIAGLLHDLGKVVLALQMPDETKRILAHAKEKNIPFYDAEMEILDFNHSDVGGWLAEHWNLPDSLADPMRCHHNPMESVAAPIHTSIVHLANILIRARGVGFGGDEFVPPLSKTAWKHVGLSPADFDGLLEELEPRIQSFEELG